MAKTNKALPEPEVVPDTINDVGIRTLVLFDQSRERPVITEIMYPLNYQMKGKALPDVWLQPPTLRDAALLQPNQNSPKGERKAPLIVFSHDDAGSRLETSWLMYALAQRGYIVASVDHYGNTSYLNHPKEALKRWERPKDISFLITQLAKHPFFRGKIDAREVGFVGFSLGGLTGVWLAGAKANLYRKPSQQSSQAVELTPGSDQETIDSINFSTVKQSFQDPNIKAVFLMAPTYGFAFDQNSLQDVRIPFLIVAGESDTVAPSKDNAAYLSQWIPKSSLEILPGKVGHYVFLNLPSDLGLKALPKDLTEDNEAVNREAVHKEVAEMAIQFFDKNLKK